jgi:putative IMPACT (imprinted ancient) family translation regulator
MEQLVVQQRVAMVALHIGCDFAQEQTVRHWLGVCAGQVQCCSYSEGVQLQVNVPQAALQRLQELAADYHWQLSLAADRTDS